MVHKEGYQGETEAGERVDTGDLEKKVSLDDKDTVIDNGVLISAHRWGNRKHSKQAAGTT